MTLIARDKAFLTDVADTNWMQHFVTAAALVRTGSDPSLVAKSIMDRHNRKENLAFMSRARLESAGVVRAQVQAMAALRIVQEYVAAMETTGALLLAIKNRNHGGGVLRLNNRAEARDVRAFFREMRAVRGRSLAEMLNLPSIASIVRSPNPSLIAHVRKLYPWLRTRIRQLASLYVKGKPFRLVSLGRASRGGGDTQQHTYVFVYVLEEGERRPARDASVIVQAMNKIKHGFNATAACGNYLSRRGARRGIVAMEIPKTWPAVNAMGLQIDLQAVMCREVARLVLDLDRAGLV